MIITVASGKGGTGKTTVAVNLAACHPEKVQLLDCDVEEPNAHLFLTPEITETRRVGILNPVIDEGKCTHCGRCSEVCVFNAIADMKRSVLVFDKLCHGCGACAWACPENAITETERPIGTVSRGRAGDIDFGYGLLDVGEGVAPPLIRGVKDLIDDTRGTVIIDAPPGTSCPVISAVKESDYCVLVTEPTPFGLNDLTLAADMVARLAVPCGVVINRSGERDGLIDDFCRERNLPVILRIPFSRDIAQRYSRGELLVGGDSPYRDLFTGLWDTIHSNRGTA